MLKLYCSVGFFSLPSRSRKAQVNPAAVGAAAACPQVPAARVAGERRGVAVHAAALQDDEERVESHDDVPGGEELLGCPLQFVAADH